MSNSPEEVTQPERVATSVLAGEGGVPPMPSRTSSYSKTIRIKMI